MHFRNASSSTTIFIIGASLKLNVQQIAGAARSYRAIAKFAQIGPALSGIASGILDDIGSGDFVCA
jgi:hypothetical protein